MPILEFIVIVGIGGLLLSLFANAAQKDRQQRQLEEAFYKLIEAQNGQISLIQLAVAAKVEAAIAQQYLQQQAKGFGATLEVDSDGDTFYRFPKLHPSDSVENEGKMG